MKIFLPTIVLLIGTIALPWSAGSASPLHPFTPSPLHHTATNAVPAHPLNATPPHIVAPLAAIDPDAAVDRGGKALRPWREFPWYDKQKDALKPVNLPADPPPPPPQNTPLTNPTSADTSWLQWFAWLAIAVLLALVIYLIVRVFLERSASLGAPDDADGPRPHREIDRVEDLPFAVRRPTDDLLSAARRAYESGQYNEAMTYLYSHQLIALDRNQFIRLAKGKTNRQYLRELSVRPELRAIQERAMVAFEDAFFGKHTLSRERFEQSWQQLGRFEQLLQQVAA